ncbi:MAG: hypothetical protein O3B13_24955 [Planctomycetota bacterium]|nr:hypothetical protein [Planctomycetota bacterium]MDA1166359.1 hypothetical protein [Planctomycetota bacterium]
MALTRLPAGWIDEFIGQLSPRWSNDRVTLAPQIETTLGIEPPPLRSAHSRYVG